MKNTETIENILRLRQLQNALQSQIDRADFQKLEKTITSLQESFGDRVRKSQAAELLGVSRQTLERWIDEGIVPVVSDARGKTEIPRRALENLLLDVRQIRKESNGEFLLRQIRRLQEETIGRVPSPKSAKKKTASPKSAKKKTASPKSAKKKTAPRKTASSDLPRKT